MTAHPGSADYNEHAINVGRTTNGTTYLSVVRESITVCGSDSDNLSTSLEILGDTSWIATILIQTNKLWDLIVLINQLDG